MYIKTPFTSTYPPTAGMMLLATIGVGDNMTALGVMMALCVYVWGREQTREWCNHTRAPVCTTENALHA